MQLAHLALVLIGEGEVLYKGKRTSTLEVFKAENLTPISIQGREGLALINGTSVMTGIGLLNFYYAERLLNWSIFTSSLINELVSAYDDHFSAELNEAKLHQGQQESPNKCVNFYQSNHKNAILLYKSLVDFLKKKYKNIIVYVAYHRFWVR